MVEYNLKQLMAMDNDALKKVARQVFSMHYDPFSELGQRQMQKRLRETNALGKPRRISPAITRVIGIVSLIIENILDYQEAQLARKTESAL